MEKNGVKGEIKGEKGGNKPAWHLRLHLEPNSEAAKALAVNSIQVSSWDVEIPFYPEDIAKLKDVIDIKNDGVVLARVDARVTYVIHYDADYNETEDGPYQKVFNDGVLYYADKYTPNIKSMIQGEINAWIISNGKVPDTDIIKEIVVSVLSKIQEEVNTKEQRLQKLKEQAKKWLEEQRNEKERIRKKAEAEIEEKRRKEEEKKQKLLSKPWVREIVNTNEIEKTKSAEIQRFKQKFSLEDDELTQWGGSDKPYVFMEASVDLRPLGISRTLRIRNHRTTNFDLEVNADTYRDYFSDMSWLIANKIAELFNGEIKVFTDDDYNPDVVYLVVVSGNDTIEVASSDIE